MIKSNLMAQVKSLFTGSTNSPFLATTIFAVVFVFLSTGAQGQDIPSKIPHIVKEAVEQSQFSVEQLPHVLAVTPSEEPEIEAVQFDGEGRVLLELHSATPITDDELQDVKDLGATIVSSTKDMSSPTGYNVIQAWIPGDQLETLEELSWVVAARPVHKLPPDTGNFESEGVILHSADEVQSAGVDGTGLTIGAISDGVTNLAAAQGTGDLPATVNVINAGSGDEGTAMLEIIHDMAPGAALAFHGTGGGTLGHITAQNNLVAAGIDILTEDIPFDAEPAFQRGAVAANGDTIAAGGVSVHSSAGNRGNQHAARVAATGTGNTPEGHTGSFSGCAPNPTNVVDIDPGAGNSFDVSLRGSFLFTLQWSEPRAIAPTLGAGGFTNLDLYLVTQDAAGNTTCQLQSTNLQGPDGSGDTIEQIAGNIGSNAVPVNAMIVVNVRNTGQAIATPTIDLRWRGRVTNIDAPTRNGSLNPDSNYTGRATSAAAADAGISTDPVTVPLEGFSSGGPVQLFQTTVCPGGAGAYPCPGAATGGGPGTTRNAPDWTAADGVEVSGAGGFGSGTCPATTTNPGNCAFFGTSASAPHAAACDALVRDSEGVAMTVAQVNTRLADSAVDRGQVGPDTAWGAGVLDCAVAARVLPPECDANGPYVAECAGDPIKLDGSGSFDPDGGALIYLWEGPFTGSPINGISPSVQFTPPPGNKTVDLTVTDDENDSTMCSAQVTVEDTLPPMLTAPEDITAECQSPVGTAVDLGEPIVEDLCDADVDVTNNAPPLFTLGNTTVIWTAADDDFNSTQDTQTVSIVDTIPPVISCNSPETIVPPDAPISFTATATDLCEGDIVPEIAAFDCYKFTKKGKRIDKTESCVVNFVDDRITILDSGGVDDNIEWTVIATDSSGNTTEETCSLVVVNPGKNK